MTVSMREMLEAGVHFGHQTRFWNPKMAPFIFGHRNKIHIINLEKTLPMFQEATKFAGQLAANRGTILMVGTKRQARATCGHRSAARRHALREPALAGRHADQLQDGQDLVKRLKDMKAQQEAGLDAMSKKEQLMFPRELDKLEKDIGGIQDMNTLPDALFIDRRRLPQDRRRRSQKLGIPIIAVVDSNHSPEGIDYVIPATTTPPRP